MRIKYKAVPVLQVIKHYAMKAYGGVDLYIHIFLTSALVGGEWLASRPCRFTPLERAPGTHWIGDWVGFRVDMDDVEKRKICTLPGLELRPLCRPVRSQSLYRLHLVFHSFIHSRRRHLALNSVVLNFHTFEKNGLLCCNTV
jgi:hypothetical protein